MKRPDITKLDMNVKYVMAEGRLPKHVLMQTPEKGEQIAKRKLAETIEKLAHTAAEKGSPMVISKETDNDIHKRYRVGAAMLVAEPNPTEANDPLMHANFIVKEWHDSIDYTLPAEVLNDLVEKVANAIAQGQEYESVKPADLLRMV